MHINVISAIKYIISAHFIRRNECGMAPVSGERTNTDIRILFDV